MTSEGPKVVLMDGAISGRGAVEGLHPLVKSNQPAAMVPESSQMSIAKETTSTAMLTGARK